MKIKVEFTQEQINVLNLALMEMPYRAVAPLINDINNQIQKQQIVKKQSEMIASELGYTRDGSGV